jgi:hypothetical protein
MLVKCAELTVKKQVTVSTLIPEKSVRCILSAHNDGHQVIPCDQHCSDDIPLKSKSLFC